MRVSEAVRREAVTVAPDATIVQAAETMESTGVGAMAVVDDGALVGIVTDRDIVCRGIARKVPLDGRIDSLMSTPVHSVAADSDLHDASAMFRQHAVRRLAVVDGTGIVGVITVDDLLINVSSHLADICQPVTAEAIFGHRDAPAPAVPPSTS